MSCETKCCTFLRGELFIGDSLSTCGATSELVCGKEKPLRKMGNIQGATISVSSEILGTENQFHYQNNKSCGRINIQRVDINLTIACTNKANMNLGFLSKNHIGDFLEGYVQDYIICDDNFLSECNLFLFKKSGVDLSTVVVTVLDEESELLQTLVLGTDYFISDHGIEMLQDVFVENGQYLRMVYDYDNRADTQEIEEFDFLSEFQGHKMLYFKGTNFADEAEAGDPFGVEVHRVLFNPVSQFDLISQGEYFLINLIGKIELDYSKAEEGLGGYFKIKRGKYT